MEKDWYEKMLERQSQRRKALNKVYPNSKIQGINIEHLRKIGYAIGLGSTDTKKEFIDKIMFKQHKNNPIIIKDENGNFSLNKDVNLLYYILKD